VFLNVNPPSRPAEPGSWIPVSIALWWAAGSAQGIATSVLIAEACSTMVTIPVVSGHVSAQGSFQLVHARTVRPPSSLLPLAGMAERVKFGL